MRNRRAFLWIVSIALIASGAAGALRAQGFGFGGASGIVGLDEEEARFLPGLYYFHKGCDYFRRGDAGAAIESWQVAAGWAVKDAQYDLGIAYFRGRGVDVDRPRGLAWLALAAERKDEAFETSLAAAWDEATPDEHARANGIWRELRKKYADEVALVHAQNRYDQELSHITGSRVGMPGHVSIWTRTTGRVDVAEFKAGLQQRAERNFGKLPTGTVDIGPLEPLIDEAPPAPPAH
jgi:hypothetical protein